MPAVQMAANEPTTAAEVVARYRATVARIADSRRVTAPVKALPPPPEEAVPARRYGPLRMEHITRAVCRHYKVTYEDIMSSNRRYCVVWARHVIMHMAYGLTRMSLQTIADRLGGMHHTTVIHGIRRIERLSVDNPDLRADIVALEKELAEGRPA